MLRVRIFLLTLHSLNLWTCLPSLVIAWGQARSKLGELIRPKCITILYYNSPLFIDIFQFIVLFLCCFGLFYTVCNFPMPKQQKQDSAVKSGHQVVESDHLQIRLNLTCANILENHGRSPKVDQRGATRGPAPP